MNRRLISIATLFSLLLLHVCPSIASQDAPSELLAEINLARSQPHKYVEYLRQYRGAFNGRMRKIPGRCVSMLTREGTKAVDEAIHFMSRRKPLPPLTGSTGLAAAAAELAREQRETGAMGHVGEFCGGIKNRIERYGDWERRIGENIIYSPIDPREMVMQLIIDDGVPERGHRTNLFSQAFEVVGIFCGPHPRFEGMCVMEFAGGFRERAGITTAALEEARTDI